MESLLSEDCLPSWEKKGARIRSSVFQYERRHNIWYMVEEALHGWCASSESLGHLNDMQIYS